ncbi:MAG: PD-(D/E)XK nuclease family protein [Flavobacteriaceae bacterium]|nr:PD-(D/E)XK nuclease family protein [Flavobacteriaceae bacterium]
MKSFLSNVVTDILLQKKVAIHNLTFVLPSQRACVFLREEIIQQLTTATFLPQIISIENYIQELAEVKQVDTIQLLFEFYSIYKKNTSKDKLDSFDTFSQWATIVLQDFNEVDRHLLDSKDLFTYLRDINRLENWNPTTEITKNYFSFFEKLHLYYDEFYQYLISKKIGYQGLIYREAESNIQHYISNNSDKHIVLVGFNALNKAEEQIFQELLQSGSASIYWDVDESYLKTSKESGMFLRKYKKEWNYFHKNPFNWIENYLNSDKKNIEFISTTKNVSQLKYVGELLQRNKNHNNMALVLADESLLSLTLNSLPNTVEKINITMGFPLSDIPLAGFFNSIFKLYLNQEKLGVIEKNLFYHKDVSNIFSHSYFKKLLNNEMANSSSQIGKTNRIFLSKNHISTIFKEIKPTNFIEFIFKKGNSSIEKVLQNCITICKELKDVTKGIEKEYVYRFFTVFQQLETLNSKYGHITNLKTLHQFFTQLSKNEKLSFQGEPLEGLQLMGMLETRVIDFETVIITSVNEGILPTSKSEKSFIPFDVKKHFGLPTYQEKDAIFSYHFYRLLHRAKNIYILYNTEGDAYGIGEKSRFLEQMQIDRNDIKHTTVIPKVMINTSELQEIPKADSVIKKLKELAKNGLSPSALSTYIYNPIDFYYQKILNIKDINEVEETVAVNTMGTVIHETLEQLYTPYIGEFLTEDSLKKMFLKVDDLVAKIFKKEYKNGDISKGKNKLIFEVSKKHVNRFLKQELQETKEGKQLKIISLEKRYSTNIEIENVDFPIKLHGIIDRIDQVDGVTRIVDYKTGMVQSSQLRMTDFSKMSDDYKYTKALQVMLYAHLYIEETNFDMSQPIEAGIISFKNLNNGFLKMNFAEGRGKNYTVSEEKINEFLIELRRIIAEIFNPEIPFLENPDKAF